MKITKYILKIIGVILGFIVMVYTIFLYIDLTIKNSLNEKNIKKLVTNIDLIDNSQTIFNTEDRIIERRINDIKIGNLTYEEKKEIIYNSKLYSNIEDYLANYICYFVGYEDTKYLINDIKKEESKKDIIKLIENQTNITDDEKNKINNEIDNLYKNLEELDLSTIINEFPKEYKMTIDYLKSKTIIYIEFIILIILIVLNSLFERKLSSPFKWLSIGLIFSTIISFIFTAVLKAIDVSSLVLKNLKIVVLDSVVMSSYICILLLVLSLACYIVLKIKHKKVLIKH